MHLVGCFIRSTEATLQKVVNYVVNKWNKMYILYHVDALFPSRARQVEVIGSWTYEFYMSTVCVSVAVYRSLTI